MMINQNDLVEAFIKGSQKNYKNNGTFYALKSRKKVEEILCSSLFKNYIGEIHKKATGYRERGIESIPFSLFKLFDTNGKRLEFENKYFERRGRLAAFAIMAWLYQRDEDISQLEDIIWAICDEYSWSLPAHMYTKSLISTGKRLYRKGKLEAVEIDNSINIDLFAAETAFALAEIIYMFEDKLSPIVVERGRKEVFRRVLEPYMNYSGMYNWELMKNNWCAVCAGSIGCAAIYLIEDELVLAKLVQRLMPTLSNFIESFKEDGACVEGLSYWTYGVSFYVSFADLLNTRTGGAIDLLSTDKFRKIAAFQHKCYFDGGCTLSFSDGFQRDKFRMGITSYLVDRFDEVYMPPVTSVMGFEEDHCYRWCNTIRDLIWPNESSFRYMPDHSSYILPDAQWMLSRSKGQNTLGLAAKGGHNDEPHNHNDIGSFMYFKNGKILIQDLGSGEYTKDYFNHNRYTIFCNNSFSHSVPIIDGQGQKEGKTFRAEDVVFKENYFMRMDISKAYDNSNLKNLIRSFEFLGDKGVRLTDIYFFNKTPTSITERFISVDCPVIEKRKVIITSGDVSGVIYYNDEMMTPKIVSHDHRNHNGEKVTVYSIDFDIKHLDKQVKCTFVIQ